jgi:hypothetical protein
LDIAIAITAFVVIFAVVMPVVDWWADKIMEWRYNKRVEGRIEETIS